MNRQEFESLITKLLTQKGYTPDNILSGLQQYYASVTASSAHDNIDFGDLVEIYLNGIKPINEMTWQEIMDDLGEWGLDEKYVRNSMDEFLS